MLVGKGAFGAHFFGFDVLASGFGVIFAIVFLVIILPGRVVFLPVGAGDAGGIDGHLFIGTSSIGIRCQNFFARDISRSLTRSVS